MGGDRKPERKSARASEIGVAVKGRLDGTRSRRERGDLRARSAMRIDAISVESRESETVGQRAERRLWRIYELLG